MKRNEFPWLRLNMLILIIVLLVYSISDKSWVLAVLWLINFVLQSMLFIPEVIDYNNDRKKYMRRKI